MKKTEITEMLQRIFLTCPGNILTKETAAAPELEGLQLFDEPLIGVGSANDPLFRDFQSKTVIGPWHWLPQDWLSDATTVISMFLPFTEAVRVSNRGKRVDASLEWLQGRIEGQAFISSFTAQIRDALINQGYGACVPALDSRFILFSGTNPFSEDADALQFGSNWSERHAAYVCGLGTFGLSKGLITEKGIAGRFCSIITTLELPPDTRPYTDVYEYCIKCGACIPKCPVKAITLDNGKDHQLCGEKQTEAGIKFAPRYGCGLCQIGVPCESRIPLRLKHN